MRTVPSDQVLEALIALNSWARSPDGQAGGRFRIRRAIYGYKGAALSAWLAAGVDLSPALVYVDATCRDCGGSGLSIDEWGEQRDHCWRCHNTGIARLEFVQTILPGGAIWHTPREWNKCPGALMRLVEDMGGRPVGDSWAVGRKGQALAFPALAQALIDVEDWHGIPHTYTVRWWADDPCYYRLPLGERPRTCAFCDGELGPNPARFMACDMLFSWGDWCCASCEKRYTPNFPPFPVPLELVSEEAGEWLARRAEWRPYKPPVSTWLFSEKGEGDLEGELEGKSDLEGELEGKSDLERNFYGEDIPF